ncbi:MBL fold metallo-hydrolase [Sulfobacillus harzensis]|uniref:MBL fold metallo-hydrolase n=1 Tax=Sulfobacillus harzensis TaxID=2729629 RepID=A0A7Y0Q1Q8_9FIRM|nr:MBL fold metallo-hydrolase [Sulfobacillus harzensis]NMP21091.1 MBL fold metallo-hydrolase [Sulfobacillus harzensis]
MEQVVPGVYRSIVPSHTLAPYTATNCYWVGGRRQVVLIDAGDGDEPGRTVLEADWRDLGSPEVVAIFATHRHGDHTGGAAWAHQRFGAPLYLQNRDLTPALAEQAPWQHFSDRDFRVEGMILNVLEAPGHTPGQWNFYLPETRGLIAGDNVLGNTTAVVAPPEGHLGDYLATLDRLLAMQPAWIGPGHGDLIVDGATRIQTYLDHRRERIAQLLAMLRQGPQTVHSLAEELYPPAQRAAGEWMVRSHLQFFEQQGWVQARDEEFWIAKDGLDDFSR